MLNRRSLDPEERTLYGANLQPPAGYVFDAAVATTFSLDFETGARRAGQSGAVRRGESRRNPDSTPGTAGRRRAHRRPPARLHRRRPYPGDVRPHSRLCSLLERIIVEVAAPSDGAFHPKMWALRFTPLRPEEPVRLRLLVLSRNLTRDRSWDIAADPRRRDRQAAASLNRPLADSFAASRIGDRRRCLMERRALVDELAEDMRRTEWSLPEPFESVSFAVNGLGGKPWRPEPASGSGVISPFCDDKDTVDARGSAGAKQPIFIGRSDELAVVPAATLDGSAVWPSWTRWRPRKTARKWSDGASAGLHAKAYIAERGWDTAITVGSGNATRPALLTGSNVEIFATLTGKRSRVGSVEEILGEKGFGRLTRPFVPDEIAAADAVRRAAEGAARRRPARDLPERPQTSLRARAGDGRCAALARLAHAVRSALPRGRRRSARLADHARRRPRARLCWSASAGQPVDLGAMPLLDLTRFLACHVSDEDEDVSHPVQHRAHPRRSARGTACRHPALGDRQQGRLLPLSPAASLRTRRSVRRRPGRAGRRPADGAWRVAKRRCSDSRRDGARLLPGRRSAAGHRTADRTLEKPGKAKPIPFRPNSAPCGTHSGSRSKRGSRSCRVNASAPTRRSRR